MMSVANASSSISPLRHQKNPSGFVSMALTIASALSAWLSPTQTPETARRCPSATRKVSESPALFATVSTVTCAR